MPDEKSLTAIEKALSKVAIEKTAAEPASSGSHWDEFDVLRALEALGAPARARVRAWLEARDAQGGVT